MSHLKDKYKERMSSHIEAINKLDSANDELLGALTERLNDRGIECQHATNKVLDSIKTD